MVAIPQHQNRPLKTEATLSETNRYKVQRNHQLPINSHQTSQTSNQNSQNLKRIKYLEANLLDSRKAPAKLIFTPVIP